MPDPAASARASYPEPTILSTLAFPLVVSGASGTVATALLAADAVEGVTATAAWVSVALSAISMVGVITRVVATDREAARAANLKMKSLIDENEALHAKDNAQQVQIDRLRAATRVNSQNIEVMSQLTGSEIRPAPDVSVVVPPAPGPVPVTLPDPEKGHRP